MTLKSLRKANMMKQDIDNVRGTIENYFGNFWSVPYYVYGTENTKNEKQLRKEMSYGLSKNCIERDISLIKLSPVGRTNIINIEKNMLSIVVNKVDDNEFELWYVTAYKKLQSIKQCLV